MQEGGPRHGAAVPALGPERSGQGTEEGHVPHLGVPAVRRGGLPHAHAQPRAAGPAVGRHVRGGGQDRGQHKLSKLGADKCRPTFATRPRAAATGSICAKERTSSILTTIVKSTRQR